MATSYPSNAVRPQAGMTYLPDSLEARGKINPIPPITGTRNGMGELVISGLESFEWTWNYFKQAEMNYWKTLLGWDGDAPYSKRFVSNFGDTMCAAKVWNKGLTLVKYRLAVIDFPVWQEYKNGMFLSVMVRFSMLTPDPF